MAGRAKHHAGLPGRMPSPVLPPVQVANTVDTIETQRSGLTVAGDSAAELASDWVEAGVSPCPPWTSL